MSNQSKFITVGKNNPNANFNTKRYTSDNLAIQDALNYAQTNSISKVILLAGTYSAFSDSIKLKSNVILEGEGYGKVFINGGISYGDQVVNDINEGNLVNSGIKNIIFDVQHVAKAGGIKIKNFTNFLLENVVVKNIANDAWGVFIGVNDAMSNTEMSKDLYINNLEIDNHAGTLEGLLIFNCEHVRIKDLKLKNKVTVGHPMFGLWQKVTDFVAENTYMNNIAGQGIYYSFSCNDLIFDGVIARNTQTAIKGSHESDHGRFGYEYVKNLTINNLDVIGDGSDGSAGLILGAVNGAKIGVNRITNCENGIIISEGYAWANFKYYTRNFDISLGEIYDNNPADNVHGLHGGILFVNAGNMNGNITGGNVYSTNGFQRYPVIFEGGGNNPNNLTISNVRLEPGALGESIKTNPGVNLGNGVKFVDIKNQVPGYLSKHYIGAQPYVFQKDEENNISLVNSDDKIGIGVDRMPSTTALQIGNGGTTKDFVLGDSTKIRGDYGHIHFTPFFDGKRFYLNNKQGEHKFYIEHDTGSMCLGTDHTPPNTAIYIADGGRTRDFTIGDSFKIRGDYGNTHFTPFFDGKKFKIDNKDEVNQFHVNYDDGVVSTNAGRLVIRDNSLENHASGFDSNVAINYYGFEGGISRFRDLNVYDGKTNSILIVQGHNQSVGIGTNAPQKKLHVVGESLFDGVTRHKGNDHYFGSIDNGAFWDIGDIGEGDSVSLLAKSSSLINDISVRMRTKGLGKYSFENENGIALFKISSNGKTYLAQNSGSNGEAEISLALGDTDTGIDWETDGKFHLTTQGNHVLTINENRRVSIGLDNPQATLHIGGNVQANDGFFVTGTDGNSLKIINSIGSAPNQNTHFLADYNRQIGSSDSAVFFGFNSDISDYTFRSKWSGTDTTYFHISPKNDESYLATKLTLGEYTLPNTDGAVNQILTTNGYGQVTWKDPASFNNKFVDGFNSNDAVYNQGGSVGIGTSIPQKTLHVVGEALFVGNTRHVGNDHYFGDINNGAYGDIGNLGDSDKFYFVAKNAVATASTSIVLRTFGDNGYYNLEKDGGISILKIKPKNTSTNDTIIENTSGSLILSSSDKIKIFDAYNLPNSDGTAGEVLATNGSGEISWVNPGLGGNGYLPVFADNNAAIAGGLGAGKFYHNGDGVVRVVF